MTFVPQSNSLGWQPIADTSSTKKHPLGTIITAYDPTYGSGEFIYLKGVAACAAKDWCFINMDDGTVTRALADGIGPLGIAMAAITASYYGWFQISGKALGACKTQFADNGAVFLTSSTGKVDDASVAGDFVSCAKGASTTTVNTFYAEFEISRPFTDDRVANT